MGSIRNDASSESASEPEKFPSPQKKSSLEDSDKSTNMENFTLDEKANPVRSEDDALAAEPEDLTGDPLDRIPSQAQKLGKKKIIIIMVGLCLALFLAALDMTIVSTALPTMAAHFNAGQSGYSWMASSYLLANAACIPLWGKISDIWGRKPILLLANFVFLVASLICGLSTSLTMIIVGRSIQGIGAGGLIVLGNICITDLFSLRERPMYYGLFGATWAIASALGPLIGGAFTTRVTWRWCFYLNLPIGGFSFVNLLLFLKIDTPKTSLLDGLRAIDWIGTITCIGGTLMFLFGLEFGGVNYPWDSPTVVCLIVFGPIVWVLFIFAEWKLAKYPIMPLRLFRDRHNLLLFLVCFSHAFVFIAGAFFLPLYFQTVLLASPILSGVYILPLVLSLSITSAAVGALIRKTGRYKEVIVLGTFLMTLGFGLLIDLKSYASWSRIIIFQLIGGVGVGPNFQSPLVALQANIHASDMAAATATFSFVRQLSTSTSIVLGTVVYQNFFKKQLPQLIPIVGPEIAARLANSFSGSDEGLIESLSPVQRDAVLEAFTYSLSRAWIFYACISAFGFIVSLFLKRIELSRSHQIAKTGLEQQERARLEILAEKKARGAKASPGGPIPEV